MQAHLKASVGICYVQRVSHSVSFAAFASNFFSILGKMSDPFTEEAKRLLLLESASLNSRYKAEVLPFCESCAISSLTRSLSPF
jgi:hypothetical protein